MLRLIHKESGDPLKLSKEARSGIYDTRDAMFLPFLEGKDVLELGCGWGYDSFLLSTRAKTVTGVDLNSCAIQQASKRFADVPNISFINDDAIHFLDYGKKFDVIVSFESLEHLTHEEQIVLIKKVWQALKPNGQLFLSTPNGKHIPIYRKNPYHKGELSIKELKLLLSNYFSIQTIKGQIPIVWFFFPIPWDMIEKMWVLLGIYQTMCKLTNNPNTSRTVILRAVRKDR